MTAASLGVAAPGVAAYGAADQPLAQIEFSGNCNNPDVEFCHKVGLGGIWLWIEIDGGAGCLASRGLAAVGSTHVL